MRRRPDIDRRSHWRGRSVDRLAEIVVGQDLQRFAAYLTMGGASFAGERILSDAHIGAKYGVPESAAALRRSLDDLDL